MSVLIAYYTQTGNTEKVAQAIGEAIPEATEIKPLADVESLEPYDFAFIGFPIMAFAPAKPAKDFLASHAAGKRLALFITHAALETSEDLQPWLAACEAAAAGADLMGVFHCQGELSEQVAQFLAKSDDSRIRSFSEARSETLGQPDDTRLEKARDFARNIMAKASG